MNTKERILAILEEHRGTAVSGQTLAQAAGVSRTAVWKAMEQLRQDGHRIQGATNRGYMLAPDSGVLCRETVLPYITAQVALVTPGAVDSTNNVAKQLAQQGAPHGTVVLSHKQTAGRGRMGRRFESPEGGIYVSILLRPQLPAQEGVRLTLGACVGVCRAMEQADGLQGQIKWVNDVYLEGKKVCGILTEAATSVENGMLEYVIVGVGVNYMEPPEGFPPALKDIAGSLYGPHRAPPLPRNRMAALLIDQLMDCLERPLDADILEEYRQRSLVVGKEVLVLRGESRRPALAEAILADGSLRVRYPDGSREDLCSGEVSIRPRG